MRRTLHFILALILVLPLCLSPPVAFASKSEARTELTFKYTPAVPDYTVQVFVEKASGNQNLLTITVIEIYPNGKTNEVTETFIVPSNSSDEYQVGPCLVYVDIKGNTKVSKAGIAGQNQPGTPINITSVTAGKGQVDIVFAIASPSGKGYTVFLSESGEIDTFRPYTNVSFNSSGVQIKKLTNGITYWMYMEYTDNNGVISTSQTVNFTAG